MNRHMLTIAAAVLTIPGHVFAQSEESKTNEKSQLVEAIFLITGLHCPPCTRTIESALYGAEGIRSIKVDWKSKSARIEYEESMVAAQHVAILIGSTPHMMGGDLHYGAWLALKVDELNDNANTQLFKSAIEKIDGVKGVALYPKQHIAAVQFTPQGDLSDQELIRTLTNAGYHVTNL
jgi:copper chaperone CopZ